jgi:hypothetical protein
MSPGIPTLVRVYAVADVPTAVYVFSATGFSNVSESLILLTSNLLLASLVLLVSLLLIRSPLFMVFPSVLASLLLASPDVAVVSCAAVAPPVAAVLSAVNVHGVLAVARVLYSGVPYVVGVTSVASMPSVFFHRFCMASLLLLAYPAFPAVQLLMPSLLYCC